MSFLPSIAGEDVDKNGIRDDVQNWIISSYTDPNVKKGLILMAYYSGKQMVNISDSESFYKYFKITQAISSCVFAITRFGKISYERPPTIEFIDRFYNNWYRRLASKYGESRINTGYYSLAFDRMIASCGYKIRNLEEIFNDMRKENAYGIRQLQKEKIETLLEYFDDKD